MEVLRRGTAASETVDSIKSKEEESVDLVGFLTKHGITNKAFAQFLWDRQKVLKDMEREIAAPFLSLEEAASGYEILGMHRHWQHRVDYMEWASGKQGHHKYWST